MIEKNKELRESMQKKAETIKSIGYIDVRVFAHATESIAKVEKATKNLLPPELAENTIFNRTNLSGHHSNPIIMLTTKLTDRKLLPSLLEGIGKSLSSLDKDQLDQEIKLHLEKGNLYLRFDKQAAFLGQIKFTQKDPIHMKIHFKGKTNEEITNLVQHFGLLP